MLRFRFLTKLAAIGLVSLAQAPSLAAAPIARIDSFTGVNGVIPRAGLTAAGNGIFYGTASAGGSNDRGTLFALDAATDSVSVIYNFGYSFSYPGSAGLTPAGNDTFLGVASGTIYKFDRNSGAVTPQASLGLSGGDYSRLAEGAPGMFYGTISGAGGDGGIFEFNKATNVVAQKASFNGTDGRYPIGGLVYAGGDIFYGTTSSGGSNGWGTLYQFNAASGLIDPIYSFDLGVTGGGPHAGLSVAGGGVYYGTTYVGGGGGIYGAIYKFDSITRSVSLVRPFDGTNGNKPAAELTAVGGGLYYGTTEVGGEYGRGSIYAFNSTTGDIILRASFDNANGFVPFALAAAGDNVFYGTTQAGGIADKGVVFRFDAGPSVPGPLPILGAAGALAWSRRLRRRTQPLGVQDCSAR